MGLSSHCGSPKHHNLFCLMHGSQTSLPALILDGGAPSSPAESNEDFYCLTEQNWFNSPPEDKTESAWEDEM